MSDADRSAERKAVAVVAVGAILPDAPDVATFWQNLTDGRYSISDVPADRWDPDWYFDPDPTATDKTYSKIGGWVRDFEWDPMAWRLPIPPKVADVMDDAQKWAVACTRAVLEDYGSPEREIDRERTAVIIGNAMAGENHYHTALRVDFPVFAEQLRNSATFGELPADVQRRLLEESRDGLRRYIPEITEDTMPGELANIIAGRVANIFDLHGPNFVTDAACASALAAIDAAIEGLDEHDFDCVITGGVDRNMGPATFVKFCKIGALSATGTRPYADGADGFVMGEGAALFMLKRLEDAERDGDRIYAVIRGVGGSSDGRGKGITAPNPAGQRLAVERAWKRAGLDPATAGYVEGHGTSTKVGDVVEFEGLTDVFGSAGAAEASIGLGSVKSNIGHLKGGAGAAGLLKTVLALHHGEIPPSLGFAAPNPNIDFAGSPLRVVDERREWKTNGGGPRRAGVSAFGFGGTNFHAVLEEHRPGELTSESRAVSFATSTPDGGGGAGNGGGGGGSGARKAPLRGAVVVGDGHATAVAERLCALAEGRAAPTAPQAPDPGDLEAPVRVAIDYDDADDLVAKAAKCASAIESGNDAAWRMLANQGAFLGRGAPAKVAFLYTGQGSQYVNMLSELAANEPIVAQVFADADRVMTPLLGRPLTDYIFTDSTDQATIDELAENLKRTEITQPAVLATDLALTNLLAAYGMGPDMVMGHSLGEYGALVAAGSLTFDSALEAVSARGREMAELEVEDNGAMAAVMAPLAEIDAIVDSVDGYVVLANVNSNNQSVLGGATAAVEEAVARLTEAGHTAMRIPVSHAFHTSIVAPASTPLRAALHRLGVREPVLPVVANVTGEFYPSGGAGDARMLDLLGQQVASPVQFVKGLHTLHDAGARVFVEVGPKRALHGFVQDVLGDHDDVLALYTNHPKQGDVVAFNRALCGLWASGHGLGSATPTPSSGGWSAEDSVEPFSASEADGAAADDMGRTVDQDTYLELGHLFAEFLDRGRAVYESSGTAGGASRGRGDSNYPVVITGAGLGVPGTERIFGDGDLRRILDGEQFIDQIPNDVRNKILEKHIVRLVKRESGDPTFEEIASPDEVIKLAGRGGTLDLAEFDIDSERIAALDTTTELAIGAGIEALRDAGLPLVMHYKTTSVGSQLPERWMLPEDLRDDTGVIFASAFPGGDALVQELDRFHEDKSRQERIEMLENLRSRVEDESPAAVEIEHELHELRADREADPFLFDRRFLFRILSMGHSQFAELIGARGPNTQINAACASTTQAVTLAEDWIRAGRCRRVVIVAADDASSDNLIDWIGSGFLASGAAATDGVVEEAALPFDNRRHGMILGMGAAGLVVESAAAASERGIRPICEVLGSVTANSAFHGTRLDVEHIGAVMESTVAEAESRGVDRHEIAAQTVFVSHETYTPARGGSASAEINALRSVFGPAADDIVIANTKGLTGHPMGAGIEDVVAVKSLETGIVPPVPNFREVDPELGKLNISTGGTYPVNYALRLAAGFGSQIAMLLLRWTPMPDGRHREPDELGFRYRIEDQAAWKSWLERVAGAGAEVEVDHHWLRVVDRGAGAAVPAQPAPAAREEPPPAAGQESVPMPTQAAPAAPEQPAQPVSDVTEQPQPVGAGGSVGDAVVERVLAMVSEATGYPADMLDPELDMEADLGIDTVKQAEVFGAIRESFGIERDDRLKLRDYPTLGHVVGFVRERSAAGSVPTEAAAGESPEAVDAADQVDEGAGPVHGTVGAAAHITTAPPEGSLEAADEIPRRVPVPEVRPAVECFLATGVELGDGTRVVICSDVGGVADALDGLLEARGVEVLRLPASAGGEDAAERVADWYAKGRVDGVYWLPASDVEPDETRHDLEAFGAAVGPRVLNLHRVMRALLVGHDPDSPPPFLVSATRLGGLHGYGEEPATAPMGGAVTGYTKAYSREQPDTLVKAVDHPVGEDSATIAERLVDETLRDPGAVEVGYEGGRRWTIGLRSDAAEDGGEPMQLGADSVFVVTGAAGSIVSAIIADLARHSGGTFHLLDLTPEPDCADPDIVALEADRDGLQRDIFERLKAAGERATPAAVERELARIERLEAALAAIEAIEDAGGTAHYHSVDLRDPGAVAKAIESVTTAHDRIDVLVHAAGIEVSRPIADKTPEEFELVFGVKSDGWVNLMAAVGDVPIGATFVFSSVAGRFGNLGQTDYSSANDLLCKYTSALRASRPDTRAIAVDWTAWADIGMATRGSIPKMMEMAGIEMLPAAAGIATLRRELTEGASRGEVLVAGAIGVLGEERSPGGGLDPGSFDTAEAPPLLQRVVSAGVYQGLVASAELDPTALAFLDDHRIDGVAVLPGVMGVEAFAEAAGLLCPDLHVVAVEDVEFSAPFKFYRDEPRDIRVVAHARADGDDMVVDCELIGERTLANAVEPQRTVHFRGSVRMAPHARERPTGRKPPEGGKHLEAAQVYEVYFHGPAFQVLGKAWRSGDVAVGQIAADLPGIGIAEDRLLMAPRLVELCFQAAGVEEMGTDGRMGLPVRIASIAAFDAPVPTAGLHALVERSGEDTFDCTVVDGRGAVVVAMEGYGTITLPAAVEEGVLGAFREAMADGGSPDGESED